MPAAPERAVVTDARDDRPVGQTGRVHELSSDDRERWAQALAARLDAPMAALGLIFLLVVLGQTLASGAALQGALAVAGWLLWAVFVAEFVLRLYVSADRTVFWRRNWWQVLFLVVPFLRFLRLVAVLRVARAGRVLSSAVRSSRSAGRLATNRLSWLAAVTVIVVLTTSQLLYALDGYASYGEALHAAALATITGEPLGRAAALPRVLDVVLAVYSVGVFATLAGALGAFFLEGRAKR